MKGLKEKRINSRLTQTELAKKLGLKTNSLCQYENGKREPRQVILKRMAEFFNCSVDELL